MPSPSGLAASTEGAVRNTRDVDLLVRRVDLPAAQLHWNLWASSIITSLISIRSSGGPQGKTEWRDPYSFSGEKVRWDDLHHYRISMSRNGLENFQVVATLGSLGADEVGRLAR